MISLYALAQVFAIDMNNPIVGPVSKVCFLDHFGAAVGPVSDNGHRLIATGGIGEDIT